MALKKLSVQICGQVQNQKKILWSFMNATFLTVYNKLLSTTENSAFYSKIFPYLKNAV